MDAQAYLLRQGWAGPGTPLNPNKRPGPHGGLGLTKPLLAARKHNTHGLGRKTTHDSSNQWWLRGFEDVLKGVGNEDNAAAGASGAGAVGRPLGGELYRFFVRGTVLEGTIGKENEKKEENNGKRKRDDEGEDEDGEKERKKLKEEKKRRKSERAEKKKHKEERRRKKQEKRERKEKKKQARAMTEEPSQVRENKESGAEDYPTPVATEAEQDSGPDEAKEASKRKEKKEKKESKEKKKAKRNASISEDPKESKSKKTKKDKKSSTTDSI